jgi:hypothetical protein
MIKLGIVGLGQQALRGSTDVSVGVVSCGSAG